MTELTTTCLLVLRDLGAELPQKRIAVRRLREDATKTGQEADHGPYSDAVTLGLIEMVEATLNAAAEMDRRNRVALANALDMPLPGITPDESWRILLSEVAVRSGDDPRDDEEWAHDCPDCVEGSGVIEGTDDTCETCEGTGVGY